MQFKIYFAIFLGIISTLTSNVYTPFEDIFALFGNFIGASFAFYLLLYIPEKIFKFIKDKIKK